MHTIIIENVKRIIMSELFTFLVPRSVGNTKIVKKANGTLVLGCDHGYRFSDGNKSRTIPFEDDCKSLTDWSEVINSNHTCHRKYSISIRHACYHNTLTQMCLYLQHCSPSRFHQGDILAISVAVPLYYLICPQEKQKVIISKYYHHIKM